MPHNNHSPPHIDQLFRINERLATSDINKFEQNRVDALALENAKLFSEHSFIHNQCAGAHEFIVALLDYYNASHDIKKRDHAVADLSKKIAELSNLYNYDYNQESVFDIDAYDAICSATDSFAPNKLVVSKQRAIDVLHRLEQNTRNNTIPTPDTQDYTLNKLLVMAAPYTRHDGREIAEWQATNALINYINQEILLNRHGQDNLDPSEMHAIIYAERVATIAIRGLNQKNWRELFYDPTFKEIVLFRDLISSYDDVSVSRNTGDNSLFVRDFENFWNTFSNISAEASDDERIDRYKLLFRHVSLQIDKLTAHYHEIGWHDFANSLWSGNLNYELMNLATLPTGKTLRERADDWLLAPRAATGEKPPFSPVE